jgi:polyketide synthase 12/myxalamid-type polyketide synthase MxaB
VPDGAYVITGGLGALGLEVAKWLVDRGARHLVLVARRMRDDASAAIADMIARGARVDVELLDVADRDAVERLFAKLRGNAVRGVVHAAGVIDDGMLCQQTWARFETVLAPKVSGALNVHLASRDAPLDFFVLFSSGAAVFPSPGQGNYAAANAFLDALAAHRRALGLPALAIDWGAWAEIGLAAQVAKARGRITAAGDGVTALSPKRGIAALEHAMTLAPSRIVAIDIEWPTVFARFAGTSCPPLLRALERENGTSATKAPAGGALADKLRASPADRRKPELIAYVRAQVGRVLSLDDGAPLPLHKPLRDFGMDSLMAVELRNGIGKALGKPLPVTALFDHPTIDALAGYVLRDVLALDDAPRTETKSPATNAVADAEWAQIEALSTGELLSALDSELDALDEV